MQLQQIEVGEEVEVKGNFSNFATDKLAICKVKSRSTFTEGSFTKLRTKPRRAFGKDVGPGRIRKVD